MNFSYDADGGRQALMATIGATAGVGGTVNFKNRYVYNAAQWLTSITQQSVSGGHAVAPEDRDSSTTTPRPI